MVKITKQNWICEQNRTGKNLENFLGELKQTIANSGLTVYELKTELASCPYCADFNKIQHNNEEYLGCLQYKGKK